MPNSAPTEKKSILKGVSAHNDDHACTPVYSVPSRKTANKHCGFINKGIHDMQMLFYNARKFFQYSGPSMIKLNQLYILQLGK